MAGRPSKLSQAPIRLELADGRADVLGDVLSLGFLRNVLYKRLDARAPWGMDVPERSRATLYLVARGQARLELEAHEPLVLTAGQVAFLPRGAAHVLRDSPATAPSPVCDGARPRPSPSAGARRIGGQGELTSILAAFSELDRAPPPLLGQPAEVVVLSGAPSSPSDPLVSATIALVLAELERPGPASVVMLQRLADVLVVHAMRSLTQQRVCRARRQEGLVALSDPPIHRALSLLHAQVGRAWSVAELAARVGLSRSGFAARFTQLVGEPPLQYLAHWRATRAAELLRDTDRAVGEIAASVGYDSTPSFNKAFKRRHGVSPGAYRRAARAP